MSLTLPSGVDRFEIVDGEVVLLSPTGGKHGQVEGNVFFLLASHVRAHRLGRVYVGEVGVVTRSEPLTVRGADVAWVHIEHEPVQMSPEGYLLTAPVVVVEVLSPNDRVSEVETKVQEYFRIGVRVVLLMDPQNQCATIARPEHRVVLQQGEALELSDLLPGWCVPVVEFFDLDPGA